MVQFVAYNSFLLLYSNHREDLRISEYDRSCDNTERTKCPIANEMQIILGNSKDHTRLQETRIRISVHTASKEITTLKSTNLREVTTTGPLESSTKQL